MKEMRRVLALLLCFVMLVGYVPVGALGAETDAAAPVETQAVEEVVEAVLGEAISVSGEKTDSKPLETGTEAPAEETETVEEIVEAVIGPVVSVSKSDSEETETEPATTEAVEETEATVETYPAETDAEEAELLEEETAYEEAVLAAVDDDALTAALEEAKAYVEGITINNSSNDPATVVKNFKTHFTWDNEKRENSKSYLFDWSYYNGVVFEGMEYLYEVTGTEEYKDYVMEYMSSLINADGSWATCTNDTSKQCAGYNATHGADCYKTASLLLDAYEMSGDERYLTVAEALYADLDAAAKNYSLANAGSNYRHTWASDPSPDLWLDGLYMILPFRAEYAKHIGDTEELDLIVDRMQWVSDNMYNSSKGLFYHAADSATSNSGTYWLRSIGWYAAAIVDIMDSMEGENLEAMKAQLKKLVDGMAACQNTSNGMWLNNMNASQSSSNPYETSGTALVCYAVMKAVNEGWLDETYADMAIVAFNGICTEKLSGSTLTDICFKGAPGSSNSTFYDNEGKGVGPFIMAYAEVLEHATREAEPAVDSLKISGKTEYYVGDTFENPTVTAVYTSGEEITVTDITVAGVPSMTEAGTYTVTVSYGGVSAEYTVSVLDLSVVSVEIENGDILTAAGKGLTDIKAQWNESHNYDVVFDTYQPYAAYDVTLEGHTAGDTASLTMTAYGVSTEDLVAYAVAEDGTVTELTIKSAVQNPEYPEYLDVTFDITGSGTYAVGSRYIAIPEGAVLQEITMVQAPSVLKYFVEEVNEEGILPLDITGLKVKATYANDTETVTKNIYWNEFGKYADGYSLSVDMTELGGQDVVISYTYGEETKTVSYGITIYEKKFASEKTDVKIELTVPGVTKAEVTDNSNSTKISAALENRARAFRSYDIQLTGYNQGEKAIVSLPVPSDYENPVAFYVSDDGETVQKLEDLGLTEDGKYIRFETDHFTTYAVGDEPENVSGTGAIANSDVTQGVTTLSSGAYYRFYNTSAGKYLKNTNNLHSSMLDMTSETTHYWYVTATNGGYYVQYGGPNGLYLTVGGGTAALTSTATVLELNYVSSRNCWEIELDGQYLNRYGANTDQASGWTSGAYSDSGSRWRFDQVNLNAGAAVTFTVTPASATIQPNEGLGLTAKVTLDGNTVDLADCTITWESSRTSVATVTANSLTGATVAGVADGTATITATLTAVDGAALATPIELNVGITVDTPEIRKVELLSNTGTVNKGASGAANTRARIRVTYTNGTFIEQYVTLDMLTPQTRIDTSEVKTITGLKANYTDVAGTDHSWDFTLNVVEKPDMDYPDYPDPGSVMIDKYVADATQFQNTGVAEIQLTAAGLPAHVGVDVVLVTDLSNSMARPVGGTNDDSCPSDFTLTKLYDLQQSVGVFADGFLVNDDGTATDNSVSIVTFGGFDAEYTESGYSGTFADVTRTLLLGANTPAAVKDSIGDIILLRDSGYSGGFKLSFDGGKTYSGNYGNTNYDYAFMETSKAIAALKAKYEAENGITYAESGRSIHVIFMTDGAPTNYNGVYYNYKTDKTRPDVNARWTNQSGERAAYTMGDNRAQYTQANWYNYIVGTRLYWAEQVYHTPGVASMFHIGFDLANGGFASWVFTQASRYPLAPVLRNMVSGVALEGYDASDAEALDAAYAELAAQLKLAAQDAYFVDQMGGSFDIQMAATVEKFEKPGDTVPTDIITLNPAPKITISTQTIYTADDVGKTINGVTVTEALVGQTYGSATTAEIVSFNAEGTQAYSNQAYSYKYRDADGNVQSAAVTAGTTNILRSDGVIYGKNFWYNTTKNNVTIVLADNSTYSLPGETFYWNIGTISNQKFTMSYYVYLSGAAEGEAGAGTYQTNNYATLYYENWLGNDAEQDVDSPNLAWKSASVYYGFYLVDEFGNPITNRATGETGTFDKAVKVTDRIFYDDILLNTVTNEQPGEIVLVDKDVLPEGYELYDSNAEYKIVINSNPNNSYWVITPSKTPNTVYVTDYHGNDYSNDINTQTDRTTDDDWDLTSTTAWFPVLWKPSTMPDVVVIDYGLPVDIGVLENDMFGTYAKLNGIGTAKPDKIIQGTDFGYAPASGYGYSLDLTYGSAGFSAGDTEVRYTPDTMSMNSFDKFIYEAQFNHPTEGVTYYYGDVTVIPATTIYYEDTYVDETGTTEYRFFELESFSRDENYAKKDGENAIDKNGNVMTGVDKFGYPIDEDGNRTPDTTTKWVREGTTINTTQAEDRPGRFNLSTIDANNVYGYDAAYDTSSVHSLGSARKIEIKPGVYGTANFSFWGTGFDVVSMTSNTTGALTVKVFDYGTMGQENAQPVRTLAVDTYYGYDYGWYYVTYLMTKNGWAEKSIGSKVELDAEGNLPEGTLTDLSANANEGEEQTIAKMCWVLDNTLKNAMYQVPVLEVADLPYGHYEVELKASYYADLDHTAATGYDLYLDAIRIYDPAGTTYDVKDAEGTVVTEGNIHDVIQDAYFKDSEAYPIYTELRNELITAKDFNALEAGTNDGSLTATGAIFIDQQEYNYTVSDYISYGPNNELYLAPGQAVAFALTNLNSVTDVQIGLKNANGDPVYVKMIKYNKDTEGKYTIQASTAQIDTDAATDRYYSIGKYIERDGDCVFSFQNTASSTGILSITNIKFTHSQNPYSIGTTGDYITIGKEEGNVVLTTLSRTTQNKVEQETPEATLDAELDVNIRKTSVKVGSNVVVKATTSADVAALTVAGVEVSKYTENRVTGKRSWTAVVKAEEVGDMRVEVIAYSADGDVLEKRTKTVEVTASKAHAGQKTIETIISKLFR